MNVTNFSSNFVDTNNSFINQIFKNLLMKKVHFIKVMVLAGILPLSGFMNDDLTNPTQEEGD